MKKKMTKVEKSRAMKKHNQELKDIINDKSPPKKRGKIIQGKIKRVKKK